MGWDVLHQVFKIHNYFQIYNMMSCINAINIINYYVQVLGSRNKYHMIFRDRKILKNQYLNIRC